ncbi:hypothetical protein EJB05_12978, partial [Eragrostis curvula]
MPLQQAPGIATKNSIASTFRFSSTLIVATISSCQILDGTVETLQFPQLKQLGLHHVQISEQMQAFTMVAGNVKILAIHNFRLSLDMVICLIQSFACLEKLYIQTSNVPDGKNLWRHKHRDLIKHLNIRLKTIVLKKYRGVKSQASFATFFILNAKMLEFMVFEGRPYDDMRKFLAEQKKLLQLEKRASRGAQFHYTTTGCEHYFPHIKHVRDLSRADPFQCTC